VFWLEKAENPQIGSSSGVMPRPVAAQHSDSELWLDKLEWPKPGLDQRPKLA
jgi:hypothetical protein